MIKLAPSILSADFSDLKSAVKTVDQAGADYIHLDVMDGLFVPSISFGIPVITSIRKETNSVFDVHLMIEEPIRYVEDFKIAGADIITVHAEACKHLDRTIMAVKEAGLKAGVALNPATPLSVLDYVKDKLDMILIMSVNPGFGGQKYIENTTGKIKELKETILKEGHTIDIQVDGGITLENVHTVIEAGATIIVAGSAIYNGHIEENVKAFKNIFKNYGVSQ